MYTARLLGDTKNIDLRRRMVNVEFTNGTNTFSKEFQFSINATVEEMKKVVAAYRDELNYVPPELTDFEYTEPVEPVEPVKTAAELARDEYDKDRAQLAYMMDLVRDGVFTGNETAITALQAKVKAGFKPAYSR